MSRTKIFDGRIIKLFTYKTKLPNGRRSHVEEIKHPGSALVVPFVDDSIVFIRQYRVVIDKYIWELPAGTLRPGETPYACAKREVTEETGYIAHKLKRIGIIYTSPGFCDEMIHIFKADCVSRGMYDRDVDELIKVRHLRKKGVVKLFKNGRISDSKTIAALAFAGII